MTYAQVFVGYSAVIHYMVNMLNPDTTDITMRINSTIKARLTRHKSKWDESVALFHTNMAKAYAEKDPWEGRRLILQEMEKLIMRGNAYMDFINHGGKNLVLYQECVTTIDAFQRTKLVESTETNSSNDSFNAAREVALRLQQELENQEKKHLLAIEIKSRKFLNL